MIINAQPHLGGVNAIVVAIHRINLVDWSSHSSDISFMASENASQCFHNAIQLGSSIHHWAGESLLIGWRAEWHSPAEEGHGFWRLGHSEWRQKKGGGCWEGAEPQCAEACAEIKGPTHHRVKFISTFRSETTKWSADFEQENLCK